MVKVDSELYPFESNYLTRPGGRMHYLDEGEGHPVVMVHGNPTWSFYFRNLVKSLSNEFRCIVPDHIGCGLSDKPGRDAYRYELNTRIEDLTALIEHAVPEGPIDLVVHDWGGAIGFGWAIQNPDRIRRLVVLNTAAFPNPKIKTLPKRLGIIRNSFLGQFLVQGLNAFAFGATVMAVKKKLPAAVKQGYLAPYDSWTNRIATYEFVRDIPLSEDDAGYDTLVNMKSGLARLTNKEMLICWGGKDFVFDDAFLETWKSHFPAASVEYFEDAGHYVLEDAEALIVPQITSFLAAHE